MCELLFKFNYLESVKYIYEFIIFKSSYENFKVAP